MLDFKLVKEITVNSEMCYGVFRVIPNESSVMTIESVSETAHKEFDSQCSCDGDCCGCWNTYVCKTLTNRRGDMYILIMSNRNV